MATKTPNNLADNGSLCEDVIINEVLSKNGEKEGQARKLDQVQQLHSNVLGSPADPNDVPGNEMTDVPIDLPFGGKLMDVNNTRMDGFMGDLVVAPNKVAKININYARTAKKVDMKRLKTIMWTALTNKGEPGQEVQLIHRIVGANERDGIRCKAFNALLYLCNENKLRLESVSDSGDFKIMQD